MEMDHVQNLGKSGNNHWRKVKGGLGWGKDLRQSYE